MNLQAIPHRRVASPPLSPAVKINQLPAATPRPWPDLLPETQIQIARILAGLLRRMLPTRVPLETEMARADRSEHR
ncbi:MAG TPA: hypothetical protein VEL09_09285 [Burkholderiales bacterium]|nr:hypothetical protein [Burkholderiales bacterium]